MENENGGWRGIGDVGGGGRILALIWLEYELSKEPLSGEERTIGF